MPRRKPPPRNAYEEANAGSQPVDEEVELRLRHAALREEIRKARDRVLQALAERQHLYLALEDLADRGALVCWQRDALCARPKSLSRNG